MQLGYHEDCCFGYRILEKHTEEYSNWHTLNQAKIVIDYSSSLTSYLNYDCWKLVFYYVVAIINLYKYSLSALNGFRQ